MFRDAAVVTEVPEYRDNPYKVGVFRCILDYHISLLKIFLVFNRMEELSDFIKIFNSRILRQRRLNPFGIPASYRPGIENRYKPGIGFTPDEPPDALP